MRNFMYFLFRVASGPRVKLGGCKSALKPTVVYSADRFKVVVLVFLFFVALCCFVVPALLSVFPTCVVMLSLW